MKSNKRRPTLIDVAKLAGVSNSSASMILNYKKGVRFKRIQRKIFLDQQSN